MTKLSDSRWREVGPYLEEALDLPEAERSTFVTELRGRNPAVADLLQTLLDEHVSLTHEQFLERGSRESIALGQKLGPYQVEALLGTGGMGEVYRGCDTRLDRTVAIKVLPPQFSSDPERRLRFEREAKAISALQNPNICALYDVGWQGNVGYLVMEYLEGETLGEWIARARTHDGNEHLLQLLDFAKQAARGLEAAHQKGIVHRDIKPANIFITRNGEVKILDFGVATSFTAAESGSPPSPGTAVNDPARSPALTRTGLAIGTPFYVSPEQIRGQKIDARSDLFSFGLVLYEMATGQLAFTGSDLGQINEAILHTDPTPIRKLNPRIPAEFEQIVERSLAKDREKRYQSATDLFADLTKVKGQIEWRRVAVARLKSPWTLGVASVLLVSLIAGGLYYRSRQKLRLTEKDTVVLADFANDTGDKVFDSTLKQALNVTLNQSPFLNVLSGDRVTRILQNMARPADTALVPEVARELCQRAGSRVYITGSIAGLDSQYIVGLKAVNCRTGDVLAQEQVSAASKEKVLSALDSAATKLRAELGESLASLQKFDLPLEEVTTPSLQALEAFSTGERTSRQKGTAAALPFHLRAVELDPNFAMAYSAVAGDYLALGETTRANEYYSKAFQLRDHTSRLEGMWITTDYYSYVTGELDKAEEAVHNVIANYPRGSGPHLELGNVYTSKGLYSNAVDEYREAVRIQNDNVFNYSALANGLMGLQRLNDARQTIREAHANKLEVDMLHIQLYGVAFLTADTQVMAEQREWFAARPEVESSGLALDSDTEAFFGRLHKSRQLTRQAVDSAIRSDNKESAGIWQENAALLEAALGNTTQAKRLAGEGLKLAPDGQGVQVEAALALAMVGETARPLALAKRLEQRYPLDTQLHAIWLAPLQAQLALGRKNPAAALADLPDIGALEFGQVSFVNNLSCMYSTYVRGYAYLAAGQGAPAAAEFQKILDHSGIVWNCWTGALAHLGLARANAMQAKAVNGPDAEEARAKARSAYNDFLTLWKDADADIPILKQAEAEAAKLHQSTAENRP